MLSETFISNVMARFARISRRQVREILLDLIADRTLFRSILGTIQDGILVLSPSREVLYANRAAVRPFGLAITGVTGAKLDDIFPQTIRDQTLSSIHKSADSLGEPVELVLPEPFSRVLMLRCIRPPSDELLGGVMLLIQDHTISSHAEKQLNVLEEQTTLNQIAAGIAHEIKNPLSAMTIHIHLAEDELSRIADPAIRAGMQEPLQILSEEIKRLEKTVQDFLFATRPIGLRRNSVDINALLIELVALFRPTFESSGVPCRFSPTEQNTTVSGDREYLRRVFINLLANAHEACAQGESVEIWTQVSSDHDTILVSFQDEGRGLAEDTMTRIFQPYFTTKSFGTGLGLTTTYRIIRQHDGRIAVHSDGLGMGTTFTVYLPRVGRESRPIESRGD